MNYYLLSFAASKYDYSSTGWKMPVTLVRADSLSEAIDKVRQQYSEVYLFDFSNLTIE